jgi:hypothetical protein
LSRKIVKEYGSVLDRHGDLLEDGAPTWPGNAETVLRTIDGAVRAADQVLPRAIPDLVRIALVEPHGQVLALVLVGPNTAVGQPEEDSLLLDAIAVVAESMTPERDILDVDQVTHLEAPGSTGSLLSMLHL